MTRSLDDLSHAKALLASLSDGATATFERRLRRVYRPLWRPLADKLRRVVGGLCTPALAAACLAGCGHPGTTSLGKTRDAPPAISATTQLLGPNGELRGTATLTQRRDGTAVHATVSGLPVGTYAIHLHAVGKCEGPKFASAGPHFNPTRTMHGKDSAMGPHLGDLPNIAVGPGGTGSLNFTVVGLLLIGGTTPLLDADGAAVVLHAGPDDYKTDPSGNSGDRIACGALAAR